MAFVKVAELANMTPNKGICVDVAGKKLALFLTDGQVKAIDELCPHRNAPLHEGMCIGTEVMCPWHAAKFDLNTGNHLSPPAKTGVKAYVARIVDGNVEVDV
jgi:nitrite reductase/ring-hydroxylating ferredoxin subunit